MSKTLIKNVRIVSPGVDISRGAVLLDSGKIVDVVVGDLNVTDAEVLDFGGALLVPGFIDIHIHGACGADVTDEEDLDAISTIAKAKLDEGCTSFAPTTLTLKEETLAKSLENVARCASANDGAEIIGVHLEGPYINKECLGAQNPAFVRNPNIEELDRLAEIFKISQITFAPEVEGGAEFVKECLKRGIVPSCGHSKASYNIFCDAYKEGLRHLTHFCNQMTPLHHRDIGLVGAGLLHNDVYVEMICDKIHLSEGMIRLVFSKKDLSKILLITDSMRAGHLADGISSLGGLEVIVKDGQARLAKNGALAGSVLKMNIALKNVYEVTGLELKDIIRTTSLNQAEELGLGSELGKIENGYAANIVVLNQETFEVEAVFVRGERRK